MFYYWVGLSCSTTCFWLFVSSSSSVISSYLLYAYGEWILIYCLDTNTGNYLRFSGFYYGYACGG